MSAAKTYLGKVCAKHPELAGLRQKSNWTCVACQREGYNKWANTNPEKAIAANIAARKRHQEKHPKIPKPRIKKPPKTAEELRAINRKSSQRYREVHPARATANRRKYIARFPEKRTARLAQYRAAKIKQTPPWADKEAIRRKYLEAWILSMNTGIEHHVDHIVPLRSKYVSGFHVEHNLQVIPKIDNLKKGNWRWPDMPK
jgi:hypothetical protein